MMKLTNDNVITIVNIFAKIKLNWIADKDIRGNFVWNYLELRKIANAVNERKFELSKKFQEDWGEEIKEVLDLRSKNKPVVGHDKFLESEMAANEMIISIFNEEVDVDLRPGKVKMEELIGVVSNCDITFEQIAFLVDKGFIE